MHNMMSMLYVDTRVAAAAEDKKPVADTKLAVVKTEEAPAPDSKVAAAVADQKPTGALQSLLDDATVGDADAVRGAESSMRVCFQ